MKSFLAVLFSLLPFLVQAAWTPGSPTANLTNYFPGREPGYGDIYASGGTNGSSVVLRAGAGIAIAISGITNTISATGSGAGTTNAIPYVYSPDSGLWYSLVSRTNSEGVVLSLSQTGVASTNWIIPGVVGPTGPAGADGTNGLDGVSGITNDSDAILRTILVGNTDGYLVGSKDGLFGYFDSNLVWGVDSGGFYGSGTSLSNAVEIVAGSNITITTNSSRRFTIAGSAFDASLSNSYNGTFTGIGANLSNAVEIVAGDSITITTNSARRFTIAGTPSGSSYTNNAGKAGVVSSGYIGTNVWGTNVLTTTGTDGQVLTVSNSTARWLNPGVVVNTASDTKLLTNGVATRFLTIQCPTNSRGSLLLDYGIESVSSPVPSTNGVYCDRLGFQTVNSGGVITLYANEMAGVFTSCIVSPGAASYARTFTTTQTSTNVTVFVNFAYTANEQLTNHLLRVMNVQNLSTNSVSFIP